MDNVLAGKLINRISSYTEYNVNIMDENGIVVASKMKERVGSFHETAYEIVKGDEDMVMVDVDNLENGVKAGVNIAIYMKKKKIGVVGVTGTPEKVLPIAKIIKMSVEVMMEYDMYKSESLKKYNLREQLMHLIFYNENLKREDMSQYFEVLNLSTDILRVPVLLQIENTSQHRDKLKKILEDNPSRSKQDLRDVTREGFLFFLIAVPRGKIGNVMQDYKFLVGEYLSPVLRYAREQHIKYTVYVGPIQDDIIYYRQAYLNCLWMQKNLIGKEDKSFYFYDHMIHYLESMVSPDQYNAIFIMLKKELGTKFVEAYVEVMQVLIENNYNLMNASAELHVHKNTLIYRLDKIREVLNMNPLNDNSDREFMECFFYYLLKK